MAKGRKEKKDHKREHKDSFVGTEEHVLDRMYVVINGRKGADPNSSNTARLFRRGRQQIAKKVGEEAVEALIEGIRGDKVKLIGESADLLYHLLLLWAATDVHPRAVWAELVRYEDLSAGKKARTK